MRHFLLLTFLLPGLALAANQSAPAQPTAPTCVRLDTNKGAITLQLDANRAPATVANFLTYVDEGFYKDTLFHRVIADFMIQGGGFNIHNVRKKTHAAIVNESMNGLKNVRGSVAMARTDDPHSATSQFFINLVSNAYLDGRADKPGYTVFGEVTDGMQTVDAIGRTATHVGSLDGYGSSDVPVKPVVIKKAVRITCATKTP